MSKSIISLLVMVLSIGIFILVGKPAYDEIVLLKEQKKVIADASNTAKSLQNSWSDLINKYNLVTDEQKDRLAQMTPDFVDNVKLMIEIEELAKKHTTVLKDIDIKKDNTKTLSDNQTGENSITIRFKTTGQYKNFMSFLAELEYSLRVVDVNSLTFRPERANTKESKKAVDYYSYDVEVVTYWLPK